MKSHNSYQEVKTYLPPAQEWEGFGATVTVLSEVSTIQTSSAGWKATQIAKTRHMFAWLCRVSQSCNSGSVKLTYICYMSGV